jgi:pyruvate kinase
MRRTKIVATVGPASSHPEILSRLIQAGIDVVRLNFSHGSQKEHGQTIKAVRRLASKLKRNVAVLQDLAGPKIRIGKLKEDSILLEAGRSVTLTTRETLGSETEISVSYKDLPSQVRPGDTLLLADGSLELSVLETGPTDIKCRVVIGGRLTSHKGINLPTRTLQLQPLTTKDRADLAFGIDQGVDYVALSFVRQASDIILAREMIDKGGAKTPVIAKIEKHEALEHIDEIIEVVDGIMIARGDLGIETPLERVPMVQKRLIRKATNAGKPVITATQMLRSMVESPRPTRAEATDIANAIFDGTDALMLSEETAVGAYPVESVRTMAKIAETTEYEFPYDLFERREPVSEEYLADAISLGACFLARKINAKAIITPTESGETARLVSRHKPPHLILALSPHPATVRSLSLSWGVTPLQVSKFTSTDDMLLKATKAAKQSGHVVPGDRVVLTAGLPVGVPGNTNMVKVMTIP